MDVRIIKDGILKPEVGDVIQFRDPSKNRNNNDFYLICQNNAEITTRSRFFLINLNGKKGSSIRYYDSLEDLLEYHKGKYKLYSSNLYELALIEKEN